MNYNMTAEEKATELIEKFALYTNTEEELEDAKQCALIAVDEIQNTKAVYHNDAEYDYWEEVLNHLKK